MTHRQLTRIPPELQTIPSPPVALYASTTKLKQFFTRPRVAIVGSRKHSAYGQAVTERFARELVEQGIVIVSGLAYGIDSIAHQAALTAGGLTLAVLPSGLDVITPPAHSRLAQSIIDQGGALISEYPPGTPALKQHFVARNRLIAGCSQVVIVPEAGANSGSLYTANFAWRQAKPVIAVPGTIDSGYAKGTNQLLKQGALPLTDVSDVLQVLNLAPRQSAQRLPELTEPLEQAIVTALLAGQIDTQALLETSGSDITSLQQALTSLEMRGLIRRFGTNLWALC